MEAAKNCKEKQCTHDWNPLTCNNSNSNSNVTVITIVIVIAI